MLLLWSLIAQTARSHWVCRDPYVTFSITAAVVFVTDALHPLNPQLCRPLLSYDNLTGTQLINKRYRMWRLT